MPFRGKSNSSKWMNDLNGDLRGNRATALQRERFQTPPPWPKYIRNQEQITAR